MYFQQDPTIAHYAGYTEEEIMPVFQLMLEYCSGDIKHEAFHNKYASKKYLKGKSIFFISNLNPSNTFIASLLVRQWAERYVAKSSRPRSVATKDIKIR